MLNNPPELQPPGLLPGASAPSQTPDPYKYPFVGDDDFVGSVKHHWLIPFDIGVISYAGSNSIQITQGLTAGQSMTVNVDQMPDKWIGAGGKLKLPAQGQNYLTIVNISTAALTVHGTIIAVGGFDLADIDVG